MPQRPTARGGSCDGTGRGAEGRTEGQHKQLLLVARTWFSALRWEAAGIASALRKWNQPTGPSQDGLPQCDLYRRWAVEEAPAVYASAHSVAKPKLQLLRKLYAHTAFTSGQTITYGLALNEEHAG